WRRGQNIAPRRQQRKAALSRFAPIIGPLDADRVCSLTRPAPHRLSVSASCACAQRGVRCLLFPSPNFRSARSLTVGRRKLPNRTKRSLHFWNKLGGAATLEPNRAAD